MNIETKEKIGSESTMGEVLDVYPGARRALFKKYQWDRYFAGTTGKGHNLRHPQMILDSEQRLKQLKKTKITKWT